MLDHRIFAEKSTRSNRGGILFITEICHHYLSWAFLSSAGNRLEFSCLLHVTDASTI